MSPTQCAQFDRMLEEQPDGPLAAEATAHMEGCTDCRMLWSDLEAIRTTAMEWGGQDVEPPEYLWIALRRQLEFEGLLRGSIREGSQRGWVSGWVRAVRRRGLAGAPLCRLLIAEMLAGCREDQTTA